MPLFAFLLVVTAALTHATWNLLAKRAVDCRHFNWYTSVGSVVLYLPLALYALHDAPEWSLAVVAALLATAVLHAFYTASLMRGYRASDLSIVYPVARGTGPLLSFVGAIVLLGERPTWVAAVGAVLVVAGVFVVAGGRTLWRDLRDPSRNVAAGLRWGVTTGLLIAAYTVNDGYAVKVLLVAPVLLDYASNVFRTVVFAPLAWRDRATVRTEYPHFWKPALGVSVLGPLGYILVLEAMKVAPVSRIAPVREMSMMIGAWLGARLLDEGALRQRMLAAGLIVIGVVALALG